MARFTMWNNGVKGDDYKFIDNAIRENFQMGGVLMYCHKYIGSKVINTNISHTQPNYTSQHEYNIQDLFYLENRDRNYDYNVYEMYGVYNIGEAEFALNEFAAYVGADTIYLEFHINDCLEKIGRKLMAGDVLEMQHLRDDALLNNMPATNKFYAITDVARASNGWSVLWQSHIYRIKCVPLTDSREFADILDKPDETYPNYTIRDLMSDYNDILHISESIACDAENHVPLRNYQTIQFYVVPGEQFGHQYKWIYAGDANGINGAEPVGSGTEFPINPNENDYFLNTAYDPYILFQYVTGFWKRVDVDYRRRWSSANRMLHSFINNYNTNIINKQDVVERQTLNNVIVPRKPS